MEIELIRKTFTETSTIGEIRINGMFECYSLEDKDRGLVKSMPLSEIKQKKIYAKTAIPEGRYQVVITYSNRFKKYLPLLINVPGFEGIRIHPGNTAADTEGCLLCGTEKGKNVIINSRAAFNKLFSKLKAVEKKEKIYITITKGV